VLQLGSKKKEDCGLLDRSERQDLLHPVLKHISPKYSYPTDTDLTHTIFKYAGVKILTEFKQKFKGAITKHHKEHKDVKTKVRSCQCETLVLCRLLHDLVQHSQEPITG